METNRLLNIALGCSILAAACGTEESASWEVDLAGQDMAGVIDTLVMNVCARDAMCGVPAVSCNFEGETQCTARIEPVDYHECADDYRQELLEETDGCPLDDEIRALLEECINPDLAAPCLQQEEAQMLVEEGFDEDEDYPPACDALDEKWADCGQW